MALDLTIAELRAALAELEPQHEGIRDYLSLDDIQESTRAELQAALNLYDRRVGLLRAALAALEELQGDGFPLMPVREVAQAVYRDLKENFETIQAALAKFSSADAVTLGFSSGTAVPK